MEELKKFEITSYLVEELENRVLRAFNREAGYYDFRDFLKPPFDPLDLDRRIQGDILDLFIKYIYVRSKPLSSVEINNWLTISLNQFKTHSPDKRKEFLREAYLDYASYGNYKTRLKKEFYSNEESFFELIFDSYNRNFHLFEEATEQAKTDFNQGYLGTIQSISSLNSQQKKKLKTNLTVSELTYLFKALNAEKIISSRYNSDIYSFISDNFSSKQQEDISTKSIKNHFEDPDPAAITFWQGKFANLKERAKKDKEK